MAAALVAIAAEAPVEAQAASKARLPSLARVGNPPSTLAPGAAFNLRYRVVNRRRRSTRAVLTARLASANGPRVLLRGKRTIPRLRRGRAVSGKRRVRAPRALAPGTYRLIACLKRAGVKAKCRTAARRIRVARTAEPPSTTPQPATQPPVRPPPADPVVLAAGDIAGCDTSGDTATANLIASLPHDVVAMLGDAVYEDGTPEQFATCYHETWGRHKGRTRPTVGNHEYRTPNAAGYFNYFGSAAGDPAEGWYSYELGTWHVVVLNSNCPEEVACGSASAQAQWLRDDLAAHPRQCTLAYWHHPLFNSSWTGAKTSMEPLWAILDDAGVDVALTGHAHTYERFAPQSATGFATADGMRQFVIGTGGRDFHGPFSDPVAANSLVRQNTEFGVLQMTLRPGRYDWEFKPVAGGSFADTGSSACV